MLPNEEAISKLIQIALMLNCKVNHLPKLLIWWRKHYSWPDLPKAEADYDARREVYKMSGQIVHSRAVVQTAEGDKNGKWTTVVAAAIFLFE